MREQSHATKMSHLDLGKIFHGPVEFIKQPFEQLGKHHRHPSSPSQTTATLPELPEAHYQYLREHAKTAAMVSLTMNGLIAAFAAKRGGILFCLRVSPFTDFVGNSNCAWWDATQDLLFSLFMMAAIMVPVANCFAKRDVPFRLDRLPDELVQADPLMKAELSWCQSLGLWISVCSTLWLVSVGIIFVLLDVSRSTEAGPFLIFFVLKEMHCFACAVPLSLLANWTALVRASDAEAKRLAHEERRRRQMLERGEAAPAVAAEIL